MPRRKAAAVPVPKAVPANKKAKREQFRNTGERRDRCDRRHSRVVVVVVVVVVIPLRAWGDVALPPIPVKGILLCAASDALFRIS